MKPIYTYHPKNLWQFFLIQSVAVSIVALTATKIQPIADNLHPKMKIVAILLPYLATFITSFLAYYIVYLFFGWTGE